MARGVRIVDPRQTYIAPEVDLLRLSAGTVLHPGTRLHGARLLLAPGSQVGTEGPAVLNDAVLGENAVVCSGWVDGAVLLRGASVGANAHVRPGTLLEEEASTAHAVGLKHSILLSFVTLGSLINFCDVLMAGGTSRTDHSEVGSGFIHFNFTPWGKTGDKATPSLVGDVPQGVFLRQRRIFLGGAGGMVGPQQVGYGGLTAAGTVLRRGVDAATLVADGVRRLTRPFPPHSLDGVRRAKANIEYLGNLVALAAWYRAVRVPRAARGAESERWILAAALENLELATAERSKRLQSFLEERGAAMPAWKVPDVGPCPLNIRQAPELDHVSWVRALAPDNVAAGEAWLGAVVSGVSAQFPPELRV